MDLLLLGTGPAEGYPVAGCPCAACSLAARDPAARPARRPAHLVLDGRWSLDATGRAHDPENDLRTSDLPARPLPTGDAGGPEGAARGVLLVEPPGHLPLLWAPQAGMLSPATVEALSGIRLGATFLGPAPESDPATPQGLPPQVECALALSRLRQAGVVTGRTTSVLVGLGHRQGGADRLAVSLAAWGAIAPPDGTRLTLPETDGDELPAHPGRGMAAGRTLILGGASSGKSAVAEDLVAAEPEVLYTATGPPVDESDPEGEWARRVRRHRERRPPWWRTAETYDVAPLLADGPTMLLDSVGTWLTGVLDRIGAWDDRAGWREALAAENDALVRAWRTRRTPLVAVSDEVGLGVVPSTPAGRLFRDELGRLNRQLAEESEQVILVVAGRLVIT